MQRKRQEGEEEGQVLLKVLIIVKTLSRPSCHSRKGSLVVGG